MVKKPKPESDVATVRLLVERICTQCFADGWSIDVGSGLPGGLHITFDHPLAVSYSIGVTDDIPIAQVSRMLEQYMQQDRSIGAIHHLPAEVPHVELVRGLRFAIAQYFWSPEVAQEVITVLTDTKCLTSEEGAWLMLAGPVVVRPDSPWLTR